MLRSIIFFFFFAPLDLKSLYLHLRFGFVFHGGGAETFSG